MTDREMLIDLFRTMRSIQKDLEAGHVVVALVKLNMKLDGGEDFLGLEND